MKKLNEWIPKLRLFSGLTMMAYLLTHLLNTSLGVISLDAMDAGLDVARFIWQPGGFGFVVPAAAIVHLAVVLGEIYKRPNLKMTGGETGRLILGLLIPYALIAHYWGSHVVPEDLGFEPDYPGAVYSMFNPVLVPIMFLLILVSWSHGCLGLHYWLRLKPWYPRFLRKAIIPAVALPVLAIAGFVAGGKETLERVEDPHTKEKLLHHKGARTDAELFNQSMEVGNIAGMCYTGLLAFVFAVRGLRHWRRKRRSSIRIIYPDGTEVLIHPGTSILDASRVGGIPHASVCGGRGRCSTCRIRVTRGSENLPAPTAEETRVLERVGSSPNVRLACCCNPSGEVHIYPLLPAHAAQVSDAHAGHRYAHGRDTEIAILFADLRGFTGFSEHKLPYDVVFVLNQYFQLMGEAIETEGGHVDKFIGDGIMALFGLNGTLEEGCRQALRAAVRMERQLAELNSRLEHDLPEPMDMGIGIHCGHVIAGNMGYGKATGLTAIGDPVNTASRLESATREYDCRLIVSEDVTRAAGIELDPGDVHEMSVRGRTRPLRIYTLREIAKLEIARQ